MDYIIFILVIHLFHFFQKQLGVILNIEVLHIHRGEVWLPYASSDGQAVAARLPTLNTWKQKNIYEEWAQDTRFMSARLQTITMLGIRAAMPVLAVSLRSSGIDVNIRRENLST